MRDATYFRWRFRDPSSRYRFVYVERDGRLAGFLALHHPAPPIPSGALSLADWECDERLPFDRLHDVMVEADGVRALAVFVAAPAGLGNQYRIIKALLGANLPCQIVAAHPMRQAQIDECDIGNEVL